MKRIDNLVDRLRKLKVRKESAGLVRVLSSHRKDVANALEAFEMTWSGIEASEHVFGKEGAKGALAPCASAFAGASRAAKRIVEVIRDHPGRTPEARVDDGVSDLKTYAKEAQQGIGGFWKAAIDSRCDLAQATADIASLAGSRAGVDLEKRVKRVRTFGIPSSQEAMRELGEEFDALEREVAKAGVPASVIKFIQSARLGSASPKDLEQDEIRRFLDKTALWGRITVRLT